MKFTKRKLVLGALWLALIGLVLPVSLLAVNPVTEGSLFNHVYAMQCDSDFTVTILPDGFCTYEVTTTVSSADPVVGGTFENYARKLVTVTFPEGMFGPLTQPLEYPATVTLCEPDPHVGANVITATVPNSVARFTVNVVTEAVSHAVGGEILSNPFMSMLPAMSLVFLMVVVLYAGRKIKKVPGI